MAVKDVRVAGVSFPNDDGTHRQKALSEIYMGFWTEGRGDEVLIDLRPEDCNRFDLNAVAVWARAPGWSDPRQVGYVDRNQARQVRVVLSMGIVERVRFSQMGSGDRGGIWARLTLVRKPVDAPA